VGRDIRIGNVLPSLGDAGLGEVGWMVRILLASLEEHLRYGNRVALLRHPSFRSFLLLDGELSAGKLGKKPGLVQQR